MSVIDILFDVVRSRVPVTDEEGTALYELIYRNKKYRRLTLKQLHMLELQLRELENENENEEIERVKLNNNENDEKIVSKTLADQTSEKVLEIFIYILILSSSLSIAMKNMSLIMTNDADHSNTLSLSSLSENDGISEKLTQLLSSGSVMKYTS